MSIKIEVLKENFCEDRLKELEITPYLSLVEKEFILKGNEEDEEGLINKILTYENGIWAIDYFAYEFYTIYILSNWYGNLNFDNFTIDDYDWIMGNKIDEYIIDKADDFWKLQQMLDTALKGEIEKRNSLSAVISRLGDNLIAKLDELSDPKNIKKLGKAYGKVVADNPELLRIVQDNLGGIGGLLSKLGVDKKV